MTANDCKGWEDEDNDEDEDEEDFVPNHHDEDDGDGDGDDDVDHDEDYEDDPEDFPSVLQGEISIDRMKGLCYKKDGDFCLVCQNSISARAFALESPVIDGPMVFTGWINDPSRRIKFKVHFSKEPMSKDPLQIQLLEAQEKKQLLNGSSTTTKTDNYCVDDNWMEKKSPAKGDLKAPPSYSLKENSGDLKDTVKNTIETNEGKIRHVVSSNRKTLTSEVKENDKKSTTQNNSIVVVSGSQIGNNVIDSFNISFRGAYRCPSKASVERLYLICPIQSLNVSTSSSVAGGTTAVAAASKKRNRSRSDDDGSTERKSGVAYQELIDLHEDTRLSTEELRKRYFGSGDKKGECGIEHAADIKRLKGTNNVENQKKDVEDEDDDDAYGF